jgi:ATP:ADP antiporter, AAA family
MQPVSALVRRFRSFIRIERHEWLAAGLAFLTLFLILCGYYLIRPIRETVATEIGPDSLRWLFLATFLSMLIINPFFGTVASFWSRRTLVPLTYAICVGTMLLFAYLLQGTTHSIWLSSVFYVWVSVFNYIAVSLFWSVMTDLFTVEQGKRLFGALSAGGTIGALLGPLLADRLIASLDTAGLMLLAALFYLLVTGCAALLTRLETSSDTDHEPENPTSGPPAGSSPQPELTEHTTHPAGTAKDSREPVVHSEHTSAADKSRERVPLGGSPWAGMGQTFASRYLLAIGLYTLVGSSLGSMIYVEQTRIVKDQISAGERTQYFARADLAANLCALVLELCVAGPLFSRVGLRLPLTALPLIGLLGIPLVSISHSPLAVGALLVLRRATEYAIAKPAREVLFTVVTQEQKYKSKNFIDTVMARGGDTLGVWLTSLSAWLVSQPGGSLMPVILVSIPAGLLFAGLGWWLAREQTRRDSASQTLRKPD